MDFELNCRTFLTHTTAKLLEKCPLKFPMVRFLRCLDPRVMADQVILSVKLFERCYCLFDAKRVHKTEVDEIKTKNMHILCKVFRKIHQLSSSSRIMTESIVSVWTASLPHISETVYTGSCGVWSTIF